jgi:wyosine [tRNA(Phe)-imidazoG37] synthetase (radical SAM superfamily)
MITFGPVPSRRLGRSLGIANVPPKTCSYSCIYCQVGPKPDKQMTPRPFYAPEEVAQAVEAHIRLVTAAGEMIDYLTFVPDGEPTLDVNLGRSIRLLRGLGIPVAVISNASLLWQEPVRESLQEADWVSLKVDSVHEPAWRRVNRPHPELRLETVLEGLSAFARMYRGTLTSETMLVEGVNDSDERVDEVARYIATLRPAASYLLVPIRPPAVESVRAPGEERLNRAFQVFSEAGLKTECLTGFEGDAFSSTGDARRDLLSITAVHPMREESVRELLGKTGSDWTVVQALLNDGSLRQCRYQDRTFYVRAYPRVAEAARAT